MKKKKKVIRIWGPVKVKVNPSDAEKKEVEIKFKPLIDDWKKNKLDKRHPEFNYRIDVYSKWYRNYFYFCSTYKSESPRRIADTFETKFTRLEFRGKNKFDIAYFRHTGQWWTVYEDKTLEECFEIISEEQIFHPI